MRLRSVFLQCVALSEYGGMLCARVLCQECFYLIKIDAVAIELDFTIQRPLK